MGQGKCKISTGQDSDEGWKREKWTDQVKSEGPRNGLASRLWGRRAQRMLTEWAGRSCHETHHRRGADGRDPGALQRSASMCYSRENGWVKIKRQEGGCSPTGRIPSIPRVCREAGGQSHSTKACPRTGWEKLRQAGCEDALNSDYREHSINCVSETYSWRQAMPSNL